MAFYLLDIFLLGCQDGSKVPNDPSFIEWTPSIIGELIITTYPLIHLKPPKISVVTATFNAGTVLADAAFSIRNQSYPNMEWIIVDGKSTDNTLEIIQSNLDIVNNWGSEPDLGIYDAWNKALKLVTGDWIIFLGADDQFASNDTIAKAVDALNYMDSSVLVAYGQVRYFSNEGRTYLCGDLWEVLSQNFYACMTVPHQGVFHSRKLFEKIGDFGTDFKIAGDYDLLLRAVNAGIKPAYIPLVIVNMGGEGVSSAPSNALLSLNEYVKARTKIGIKPLRPLVWYLAYVRAIGKVVFSRWFGLHLLNRLIRIWAWLARRNYPR